MMQNTTNWLEHDMQERLDQRAAKQRLRVYQEEQEEWKTQAATTTSKQASQKDGDDDDGRVLDFSSNDYLGLARDPNQQALVEERYHQTLMDRYNNNTNENAGVLGATGSRLLSGDSGYARQLEVYLAKCHEQEAALLFNSGYDANLAVVSCLPADVVIYDEYAHNSLQMGLRLRRKSSSQQQQQQQQQHHYSFQHNNVQDLKRQLERITRSMMHLPTTSTSTTQSTPPRILILVESVYSMDGDVAPLQQILDLALEYHARVLVDEAHGLGVFGYNTTTNNPEHPRTKAGGTGVLAQYQLQRHPALVASVYTFGKAAGCHGAVICGSKTLRQYLWNYGFPLVYSTSLPLHSLVTISCAYESMTSGTGQALRQQSHAMVQLFRELVQQHILRSQGSHESLQQTSDRISLLPSTSPIQALMLQAESSSSSNHNPHDSNHNHNHSATSAAQLCTDFCRLVWDKSAHTIRLYPIKAPTVPLGAERIRIILHSHNTPPQVHRLVQVMVQCLMQMNMLGNTTTSSSTTTNSISRASSRSSSSRMYQSRL